MIEEVILLIWILGNVKTKFYISISGNESKRVKLVFLSLKLVYVHDKTNNLKNI